MVIYELIINCFQGLTFKVAKIIFEFRELSIEEQNQVTPD